MAQELEFKPGTALWAAYHKAWSDADGKPEYVKAVWRDQVADALRRVAEAHRDFLEDATVDCGKGQHISLSEPVRFTPPPSYGIWCNPGWLRTENGMIFQSWSPNAMQAVIREDIRSGETVREIGPDGLPLAVEP